MTVEKAAQLIKDGFAFLPDENLESALHLVKGILGNPRKGPRGILEN
jgi:hypothetical protein